MVKALTLQNACEIINKFESLDNFNVGKVKEFLNNELTKKNARKFLELIANIHNIIDDVDVPDDENKQALKSLLTWAFTKWNEAECRGDMLVDSLMKNKKYQQVIKDMKEAHQAERNELNAALTRLNEQTKPEKVDFQSVTFSVTTIEKQLSNAEFMALSDSIDIEDKELDDKFKRVKVPKGFENKVSRVYAKEGSGGKDLALQKVSTRTNSKIK